MALAIFANCNVQYDGRASSTLENGNYLIIIKEDKTIQIQGYKFTKALNYINFKSIEISNNKIIAKSKNEQIIININAEISRMQMDLSDNKPKLINSEDDLVNKLINNVHLITTDKINHITKEHRTKYGNIDLFIQTDANNYIIEVKRHRININACKQIQKYLECEKGIGILCAPKIIKSAADYCAENGLKYLSLGF